jgi:excisionase family DNA binding protein
MTDTTPATDVLNPREAAAYLRVNPQTVYRLLNSGALPGAKIGRTWRVRRADLDRFLAGSKAEERK